MGRVVTLRGMLRLHRTLSILSMAVLIAASLTITASPATASPSAVGDTGADLAATTVGDAQALHILVATGRSGYRWRTAASLSEPGYDTDEWIGQLCVTGSGHHAVAVYAPRQFTNRPAQFSAGAFVAVINLDSGAVTKLPFRASLAYYNPGCGGGETAAVSTLRDGSGSTRSVVTLVDAATGSLAGTADAEGQLTSAVPFGTGVAAALGNRLVAVDRSGTTRTLATVAATPFRLHPDRAGGLAFEVPRRDSSGDRVEVRRYAGGHSSVLGTGRLDGVRLAAGAAAVFVTGPDAGRISIPKAAAWSRLGGDVQDTPSSTGALLLTGVDDHRRPTAAAAAAGQLHSPDRPDPVDIHASRTSDRQPLSWRVQPDAGAPDGALAAPGSGGGRSPGAITPKVDGSTVPWDPDRGCAVPRNDPGKQVFQATAKQVEWAVDLAVQGALSVNRPANFRGSGVPVSWSPQGMFAPRQLSGAPGATVPAQVLLGVLAQESNLMQASPHAVDGVAGNVNQGGFYGDGSSWSTVDCGYGVGQVTTGMSVAEGSSSFVPNQQLAIAADYASNVAASLNLLIDKWNALKAAGIQANDGNPDYVENWWFALWAYNSGIQPRSAEFGNTTGCTPGPACTDGQGNWGLGWSNNPANPDYPVDRHVFHSQEVDTHTPNLWPYQERVLGWARFPLGRYNYANNNWEEAFLPVSYPEGSTESLPDHDIFCTPTADHCTPAGTTDSTGAPGAGLCQRSDLHCWWHQSITWVDCAHNCGTELIQYSPGDPEPGYTDIYPPDCSTAGLPSGTVIVDDVTTASVAPCTKTWTNQGSFSFYFPPGSDPSCTGNCITYPGKIDFHQLGVGFGGHIWFTHMADVVHVVGAWTPPSTVTGWRRIKVHIPDNGAATEMADYQINLGNGQTRHRLVNQDWGKNTWVDLGSFNLSAGASVSLSNVNTHVVWNDGRDVAFDAVAFIPSTKPYASYVALGDSYSSGEGLSPYELDSDQYNDGDKDSCHRSGKAYSYQVRLSGRSTAIAADAAANKANFHFLACSGAESVHLTAAAVDTANTWNTDWGSQNDYHSGEPYQIDSSGWLDVDTSLVTLSIGGNDARFSQVFKACVEYLCTSDSFKLTRSNGSTDPQVLTTYEPKVITALRSHLVSVYSAIHAQAPNARVVVVGYPRLFASKPTLPCQALIVGTQVWMNSMADQLNQTIMGAVTDVRAKYPGMTITAIDPSAGFTNHTVCDQTNWVNGITSSTQTGSDGPHSQTPGAGSFHPTAPGQAEYAALVNAIL